MKSGFTAKDMLTFALIGGGIYFLYKIIKGISPTFEKVGQGVANVIVWATEPPAYKTTYSFLMPDGSLIDPATVNIIDGINNGFPGFNLNGTNYIVKGRDDVSGDYIVDYASINDVLKHYG